MPTQLSFDHHYIYDDNDDGIILPTILSFGDKVVWTDAVLDSGAKFCVFSNDVGRRLGLEIERGIPQKMGSSAGGVVETFGHEIILQTLDVTFEAVVYFAKYPGLRRNLLGRIGWLRFLRMALIDYDNTFYYGRYDQ